MAAPDDELPRGIARFWSADGRVTGSGFLIAERTLCTCAHVVASALGTDETAATPPTTGVTVDFPLLHRPSPRLGAQVTHWHPVTPDGGGDIALLALASPVPGTAPVRFAGGTAIWDHAFRVLGFPLLTDDHGVWVDGRLRAPVGKGWTSMEARPTHGSPTVGRGFSGGPVWDTEQGGVVGMTVAADTGTGATTAYLIPAALLLGLDPALRPSPFRGLEAFREQDAAVFFARRADSERIAEALRDHGFVPVAGASGVGKSSLVRAGVLPLLRREGHTVTDFVGQPDTDPVWTLAESLAVQFPAVRDLARQLSQDREAATLLGARILEHSGTAGHVILLDQFEETVGARPADARALLDTLLLMARAAHSAGRRLRVLATLRSASLEELVTGGRAEALSGTVQMVAPMTRTQLDDVVRLPVDAIPGIEFEPGLAELIVTDAGGEPGALPLVEFALAELWDRQHHGRLTHAAYREIGGVEGALSRYADHQLAQVCKTPEGPDETTARRLFERLARPVKGKEYARVARAFDQLPPELRTAAQALAATRLLVISRDSSGKETVALAHEALVRQWPMLRDWLDESHVFLAWHEKLRGRLREWEDGGRHDDLLLRGQELTTAKTSEALRPAELSHAETEFVRLSREWHRRAVRRGRMGVALVACLAVMAGMLGYGLWTLMRDRGQGEKDTAAQRLADHAANRALKDPVGAALLAIAAHRTSDLPATRQALMRHALPLSSLASAHRILPAGSVTSVAASADGRVMVVLKGTKAYAVTGLERERPKHWPLRGAPWSMGAIAVSDDGQWVAGASASGEVRVWELDKGRPRAEPRPWSWHPDPGADRTVTLDFSGDGRQLVHQVDSSREGTGPCAEDDLRPWVRLFAVRQKTEGGEGTTPPENLLQPGECLHELALRPAESGRLTVVTSPAGEEYAAPDSVRSVELSTGETEEGLQGVDFVSLAPGGRALTTTEHRKFWWQPPAGSSEKPWNMWADSSGTDASGRYEIANQGYGNAGENDALGYVVRDLTTGARYHASLPEIVTVGGTSPVMTRTDKGVAAYVVLGRDVLQFGLSPESPYPLGEDGTIDVTDMDRVGGTDTLVLLAGARVSHQDGSYSEPAVSEVVLDADGLRRRRFDREDSLTEIVVSEDGRSFIAWGEAEWDMRTTAKLKRMSGAVVEAGGSSPGNDVRIESVRRFGHTDFLLLDGKGLAHVDGTGRFRRLDDVPCAWNSATGDDACITAVGRPDVPGEFLVLRADGAAELWRLVKGRAKLVDHCEFPVPAKDVAVEDESLVLFRPDGRAVAVLTENGVSVWRLGKEKPGELVVDADGLAAYDRRGRLVLSVSDGQDQLWNDRGRDDSVQLPADDDVETWVFDGDRLTGETGLGRVTYDLGFLTSRTPADDLCKTLPPHVHGVWGDLLNTVDFPPGAHKAVPCPAGD